MLKNISKSTLGGMLWIVLAVWFVFHLERNPWNEYRLITSAQETSGQIVKFQDKLNDDYNGNSWNSNWAVYEFRSLDGKKHTGATEDFYGRSPVALLSKITVQYVQSNPKISRVKGTGLDTLREFIIRRCIMGSMLLVLFASPGIVIMRNKKVE